MVLQVNGFCRFQDAIIGQKLGGFLLCHERNIAEEKIIATFFVSGVDGTGKQRMLLDIKHGETQMTEVPMNEFEPVITQSAASLALNAMAPYAEQFAVKAKKPRRKSVRELVADYDERGVRIG